MLKFHIRLPPSTYIVNTYVMFPDLKTKGIACTTTFHSFVLLPYNNVAQTTSILKRSINDNTLGIKIIAAKKLSIYNS